MQHETATYEEIKTILINAYRAFRAVVNGEVEYKGFRVVPDLAFWGMEPEDLPVFGRSILLGYYESQQCPVCLAGAWHLAEHGKLVGVKQGEVERFLDKFRQLVEPRSYVISCGMDIEERTEMLAILKNLGIEVPAARPERSLLNSQHVLAFLEETLALNGWSAQPELPTVKAKPAQTIRVGLS